MPGFSDSIRREGGARRARTARWILSGALLVLAMRLVHLQVVEHARLLALARKNILREEVLPAVRGVIRDREGRILVDSVPSFTVAFDPYDTAYLEGRRTTEETLETLATIIDRPAAQTYKLIRDEQHRSYRPVRLRRHLKDSTVAYIEERRDHLPGVIVEVEPMRRHVHGRLAAHLLGHVGEVSGAEIGRRVGRRVYRAGDVIGRLGIEKALEAELCGQNGRRMIEVDALGRRGDRLLPFTSYGGVEPPVNGEDLVLTIDLEVQRAAEAAFPDSAVGAVVVLDVRDGGILALLSRPAFDPNEFAQGMSVDRWQALNSNPGHALHNRALQSGYPPGSVFKVVTGLAALTFGHVGLHEVVADCEGGYQLGNRWFRCHHVHGKVAFAEAMTVSCDTYFYQVGLRVGLDRIVQQARRLGFGSPTGIDLPEAAGLVPDRAWFNRRYGRHGWTNGHVLNLSIGQGEILASPLQMAAMMALVARGGRPLRPHVVKSIGDVEVEHDPPERRLSVESGFHSAVVRSLERVVVGRRGTGTLAAVPGVRVAGKTGTSQNPHGEDHAIFAGFAPVDDPRIAFAVVVENGGHGGETAAPIAARVIEACQRLDGRLWAASGLPGGAR